MVEKLREMCEKAVVQEGLSLYDMEYITGQTLLRLYISRRDKVTATLEDCVRVDHALTPFIDEADWIPNSFQLEVSSPGVYRNLKTSEHFESAIGQMIKVKYRDPEAKGQKTVRGSLKSFDKKEETIIIEIKSFPLTIKLSNITKAHVDPDWDNMGKSLEGDL